MKSEFILLIHMMVILTLAAANPAAIEKDAMQWDVGSFQYMLVFQYTWISYPQVRSEC